MRTGLNLLKVAVAVAVAVSVSNAMAQGGGGKGGRGFGGGRGVSPITLVKVEGVQKDLELSQDQKDKVAVLEATQVDRAAMQGLSQEERQKKSAEVRDAEQKKVDEVLLPPQRERLAEIMLQLEGARALRRPEVAAKLKLTDDQKQKLEDVLSAGFGGGGGGPGGFAAAMEEMNKKAMDVLTADQQAEFTKMKGKKTEVSMQDIMGAGGFGGKGRKGKGNKGPDA
jgi:hypothetical protein